MTFHDQRLSKNPVFLEVERRHVTRMCWIVHGERIKGVILFDFEVCVVKTSFEA